MLSPEVSNVDTISIDKIHVVNPRARSRRVFREVVASIAAVGLKRPITVTRRERPEGTQYDLVCGQGRLEACQSLAASRLSLARGQTPIPGYGLFDSNADYLCLSGDPTRPSIWRIPPWLGLHDGGVRLSYHGASERWEEAGTLRTVAKGQEFVADIGERTDAQEWLIELFAERDGMSFGL